MFWYVFVVFLLFGVCFWLVVFVWFIVICGVPFVVPSSMIFMLSVCCFVFRFRMYSPEGSPDAFMFAVYSPGFSVPCQFVICCPSMLYMLSVVFVFVFIVNGAVVFGLNGLG